MAVDRGTGWVLLRTTAFEVAMLPENIFYPNKKEKDRFLLFSSHLMWLFLREGKFVGSETPTVVLLSQVEVGAESRSHCCAPSLLGAPVLQREVACSQGQLRKLS